MYFYPASKLNGFRRTLADILSGKMACSGACPAEKEAAARGRDGGEALYSGGLSYLANCANHLSREVYLSHGASCVEKAYELSAPKGAEVMRSKYCIRYELGLCPSQHPVSPVKEPLYLVNNGNKLKLEFDCRNCEMVVIL